MGTSRRVSYVSYGYSTNVGGSHDINNLYVQQSSWMPSLTQVIAQLPQKNVEIMEQRRATPHVELKPGVAIQPISRATCKGHICILFRTQGETRATRAHIRAGTLVWLHCRAFLLHLLLHILFRTRESSSLGPGMAALPST